MTENAKNPTAQKTIQDPPEYNAEKAKNPKEGSDWLGGPQNGNKTPGKSTEGAYQQNGQTWLGGPQNGDETPSTSTEGAYQSASHSTGYTDQLGSADWLGGPQNGNEIPGNGGNGGNGDETPGHEKKAPKGSLSGGVGFEKPSSSSEASTRNDATWTGRGKESGR